MPSRMFERGGRPGDPRIGRIGPAGLEETALAAAQLNLLESISVEVAAERRDDVINVRAHHVAELAMGARLAGNGVHRPLGRASGEGKHLEAVPAEHALGRGQLRLTPVMVDCRSVLTAVDLDALKYAPHRLRQRR